MTTIAAFAIAGLITSLLRCSMVVIGGRFHESRFVESTIGLIAPAVLTAIVASALLLDHGEIARPDLASVVAVSAAAVAVRRTSQMGLALAVGLPTYWLASLALTASSAA